MPPSVALLLWLSLLVGLLCLDPAREPRTSAALWVSIAWMFIISSRLPSQWFGGQVGSTLEALEDGNSIDRVVYSLLILLAIGILMTRSFNWSGFAVRNIALSGFLFFTLLSVLWSDFPLIAAKRWFRDLGNYLSILVILSDPCPFEALRTFFRRLCYLLVPLSVVIIKYFPATGIHYSFWTGAPEYVGVATSKNTLGFLCLMSGLFLVWDTVTRWPEQRQKITRRIFVVNFVLFLMTVWLLRLSNSATSELCLLVGCLSIVIVSSKWGRRHLNMIKILIPSSFFIYAVLAFGFGLNGELARGIGRDPTLTGRETIWNAVLSTNTNPLIGTGYQSFWLGPRLEQVWRIAGPINEAHNGYLDTYLNLGMIGLMLVGLLLISAFKRICFNLEASPSLASLGSAFFLITLLYNITEASFTAPFLCVAILLETTVVPGMRIAPRSTEKSAPSVAAAVRGRGSVPI